MRVRTANSLEADLAALRVAADRAGSALACMFSSSDEFEAHIIRKRRAEGAYRTAGSRWRSVWRLLPALLLLLGFFLFLI